MELNVIIQEIQQLPLSKRFFVMEQTLKSIKNEELKHHIETVAGEAFNESANDKELLSILHLVSEKSLAKDWLSEEDDSWDKVL